MLDFLQSFSAQSLIFSGACLALIVYGNRAKLLAMLPKLGVTSNGDDDVAAYKACRLLLDRFTKLGCPEGIAAAKACLSRLFDEHYPGT